MALLSRRTQVAARVEATPGTYLALSASHAIKVVGDVPLSGFNPLKFPDETIHDSLGANPQFSAGIASWNLPTISVAMAGHVASTSSGLTKLTYGPLLEACGFEALDGESGANPVEKLTIASTFATGSEAGPFRHGEVVTGSGSGEEGVVIGDTWEGTTTLYVEDTAGNGFSNGDITGSDSGAIATVTASAAYNPHAYRLTSDPDDPVTLTIGIYTDGKVIHAKGCRGNVVIRSDFANRPFLDFSFTGIVHKHSSPVDFHLDSPLLTGVTYSDKTAPASLGLGLSLNDGSTSLTPLFNRWQLDLGNQVELIEDSNDSDGWDVARIVDRNSVLTMNPREVLSASYKFIDNMLDGVTARGRVTFGTPGTGNAFTIITPFLDTQSLGGADRQGVREWDGTFGCTKGSYTLDGVTTFGTNNSVVLIVE